MTKFVPFPVSKADANIPKFLIPFTTGSTSDWGKWKKDSESYVPDEEKSTLYNDMCAAAHGINVKYGDGTVGIDLDAVSVHRDSNYYPCDDNCGHDPCIGIAECPHSNESYKTKLERRKAELGENPHPAIFAAGMSAALPGYFAALPGWEGRLVIGVPVSGSKTMGLDSLLSSQEMPPMIPVAATQIDGSYAAVQAAFKLAKFRERFNGEGIFVVYNRKTERGEEDAFYRKKVFPALEACGIPYRTFSVVSDYINLGTLKDSFVLSVVNSHDGKRQWTHELDEHMRGNKGVQLIVHEKPDIDGDSNTITYTHYKNPRFKTSMQARFGGGKDAVFLAAKAIVHEGALAYFKGEMRKKAEKTRDARRVLIY